jgi:glycine/D-amino acid oxidase-like deaminating enzyme
MREGQHAFVLGSGIAGLSTAEILTRNGYRVTVVESAAELGGDASRSTQNWLHTGWVYATLPHDSAMRACHRSLNLFRQIYDPVLPPDMVNVELAANGRMYTPVTGGDDAWFSPERVQYLFALATRDIPREARASWAQRLDRITFPRLRALGYPTEDCPVSPGIAHLLELWEEAAYPEEIMGSSGSDPYRVVTSTDARMDSRAILSSLLTLLGERTEVVTDARYILEPDPRDAQRSIVRLNGEAHRPDLVVIAAGKNTPELLHDLGCGALSRRFRSSCSPVVLLDEALDLPSFIRVTPELSHTMTHVRCVSGGRELSTLGSFQAFPLDVAPDVESFVDGMCARMGISTSRVVGSYFGTKTELTGEVTRQYNHAVEMVNTNTCFAIAGKFSQFPLLVSELAELLDLSIKAPQQERGASRCSIGATAPELLLGGHRTGRISTSRVVRASDSPISRSA